MYTDSGDIDGQWLTVYMYTDSGDIDGQWLTVYMYTDSGDIDGQWLTVYMYTDSGDIEACASVLIKEYILHLGWLWPDIPSRDLQIITENRRFEVIIWGSRDGIAGHNHSKMQYLFRFYHGLCILWGNKVRISANSFDKQIRSIGRGRRKLNSIYSLGRILDDIPRQTENETWNFHSWLYY